MKSLICKPTRTFVLLLSILGFAALSSCEKDGQGGGKPEPKNKCTVYGTFTRVICGTSIYDGYWIKLDGEEGKYLQPCATDVKCSFPIQEGTRIRFGYKKATGITACDDMTTCEALDIRVRCSERVKITCMELIEQPKECSLKGIVYYHETCQVKYIQSDGAMFEPVNQEMLSSVAPGESITFSYDPVHTFQMMCTGSAPVSLTCVKKAGAVCKPLLINSMIDPAPSPGIHIRSASIEGNCLKMDIGFSGCEASTEGIDLFWSGGYAKSSPPQVTLFPIDSRGATCMAYFTQEVSYDLSEVRKGIGHGPIQIRLQGWNEPLYYY